MLVHGDRRARTHAPDGRPTGRGATGPHVAVFASMKRGLEHFVRRELGVLAAEGATIDIFPTKVGPGLHDPDPTWRIHRWSAVGVVLGQPRHLLRSPRRYLSGLREAVRFHALVEFALAWHFAPALADADVLYATFGDRKLFIGHFAKRALGTPLVVTVHAYELYANTNPDLFRHALAGCDRVITVTEYNRELLVDRFGVDPERLEVVRISVDLDDYRPASRFVVLIVAFFNERKGFDTLFQAVRDLGRDDVEVWVVGDRGAEGQTVDVEAMAHDLGIEDRVAFFGPLRGNALKAVYRACDAFCLPSRHDRAGVAEGFPTAIAEAMAFGKPVISTRHVEIPRVLPEIVVDEGDAAGVADAIAALQDSPGRCAALGEQNRRIAERELSTANARRTGAILGSLAAARAR